MADAEISWPNVLTPKPGRTWADGDTAVFDAATKTFRPSAGGGGGGGGGGFVVATFAFDASMLDDLLAGVDTGITIPDGAYLPNGAIAITVPVGWDGSVPVAMVGNSQQNALAAVGSNFYEIELNTPDGLVGDPAGTLYEPDSNSSEGDYFVRGGPVELWLAMLSGYDGANASYTAPVAPATPLTVVTGVNDEFVWTPGDTGIPDTFTIAPGTYADASSVFTAMALATDGSAAFQTVASMQGYDPVILLGAEQAGAVYNASTISAGEHDVAAALGFTSTTAGTGGVDAGGSPESTVGNAILYVSYYTPSS